MDVAKRLGIAVVLVGHVTKEGAVAGPRVLEHLVDCVLLFEGERERSFRTLRALKNRFGATSEVGVFEMRAGGLVEVADASARFVAEASAAAGLGRALLDGGHPAAAGRGAGAGRADRDRPAAADRDRDRPQPAGDGARGARPPRRPSLAGADVFVNVAGGVRVDEPGADLAVALAIASAQRGESLADGDGRPLACFGEIGLTGELRYVGHADRRVAEALKFGLARCSGRRPPRRSTGLTRGRGRSRGGARAPEPSPGGRRAAAA